MDKSGSFYQGKDLDRRKQDLENRIRLLQQEKLEKERTYSSLTNENDRTAKDIQRLTRSNLEKEENIRDLKLTIENQKREVENQKASLASVSKKKSFLCC
jgi:chromosome segregation ATPase